MGHGLWVEHHAAAGGDDRVGPFQFQAYLALDLIKSLQAVLPQDLRQGFAGLFYNEVVHVYKFIAQPGRQCLSHHAFAGAGHPDQHNIVHL